MTASQLQGDTIFVLCIVKLHTDSGPEGKVFLFYNYFTINSTLSLELDTTAGEPGRRSRLI